MPRKIDWTPAHHEGRLACLWTHVRLSWRWRRLYVLHCWAGGLDEDNNCYSCMRPAGHFGKHEPTPDGEIAVAFV